MFQLRTAAAAALVGAMLVAAPALVAQAAKAPSKAPSLATSPRPKKEPHGFKRYDTSKDGIITLAEFKGAFAKTPRRLSMAEKRFKRWDANSDGKITKLEWDTRNKRKRNPKPKPGAKPTAKPAAKK